MAFNERQRAWLAQKFEREAAMDVILHRQKRCHLAQHISEADFWTLLFSLIHAPDPNALHHPCHQQLMEGTE